MSYNFKTPHGLKVRLNAKVIEEMMEKNEKVKDVGKTVDIFLNTLESVFNSDRFYTCLITIIAPFMFADKPLWGFLLLIFFVNFIFTDRKLNYHAGIPVLVQIVNLIACIGGKIYCYIGIPLQLAALIVPIIFHHYEFTVGYAIITILFRLLVFFLAPRFSFKKYGKRYFDTEITAFSVLTASLKEYEIKPIIQQYQETEEILDYLFENEKE